MSRVHTNLLVTFHKWACDRGQDENFTTDAFAFLLDYLAQNDPAAACGILSLFGCPDCKIEISTQNRYGDSQPDIEIVGPNSRILIEVKLDAPVEWDQIERHQSQPKDKSIGLNSVALLTKNVSPEQPVEVSNVRLVRWYEVAEAIQSNLSNIGEVGKFLARQFLEFLGIRGMIMRLVTAEFTARNAVSSYSNLMEMLNIVLEDSGFKKGHVHEHLTDGGGFYFGSKNDWNPYWCGLDHEKPDTVYFAAYDLPDFARTRLKGNGWLDTEEGYKRHKICRKDFHLTATFFNNSALDQKDQLKGFIESCLQEVKSVTNLPIA